MEGEVYRFLCWFSDLLLTEIGIWKMPVDITCSVSCDILIKKMHFPDSMSGQQYASFYSLGDRGLQK